MYCCNDTEILFFVHFVQVETLRADNTFVSEQMANCKGNYYILF